MDNEEWQEQWERVVLMASGSQTWDLSPNDLAALSAVVSEIKRLWGLETAILDYRDAVSAAEHVSPDETEAGAAALLAELTRLGDIEDAAIAAAFLVRDERRG